MNGNCCPLVAVDRPPIARIDPFDVTLAGRFTLAGCFLLGFSVSG